MGMTGVPVTPEEARSEVQDMSGHAGDRAVVILMETALWENVLATIALGKAEDPAALCEAALESREVTGTYWLTGDVPSGPPWFPR